MIISSSLTYVVLKSSQLESVVPLISCSLIFVLVSICLFLPSDTFVFLVLYSVQAPHLDLFVLVASAYPFGATAVYSVVSVSVALYHLYAVALVEESFVAPATGAPV